MVKLTKCFLIYKFSNFNVLLLFVGNAIPRQKILNKLPKMSFDAPALQFTALNNLACCGWTYINFKLYPNAQKALFKSAKDWGLQLNKKNEWEGFTVAQDGVSLHIPCSYPKDKSPSKYGIHQARMKSDGKQLQKQCAACMRFETNAVQRSRYQIIPKSHPKEPVPFNRDPSLPPFEGVDTTNSSDASSMAATPKKPRLFHRNMDLSKPGAGEQALVEVEVDELKKKVFGMDNKLNVLINHLLNGGVPGSIATPPPTTTSNTSPTTTHAPTTENLCP
jgi:hypothetical protein